MSILGEKMFTARLEQEAHDRNMKRGPQVYDLPVANLHQHVGHYVPPKARSDKEAKRRRKNPANTVILEAQTDGADILGRTFEYIAEDEESRDYFARKMGGVCLNTAWYSYANLRPHEVESTQDNVTRRRLELPKHVRIDDEGIVHYETLLNNRYEIESSLSQTAHLAYQLETSHRERHEIKKYRLRKHFGHTIGNLGLRLAATPLIGVRDDPYVVQTGVRNAGRDAIETSRELYDGKYPTVAQLPDLDSQLAVHLRRDAPTPFRDALIEATAQVHTNRAQINAAQYSE